MARCGVPRYTGTKPTASVSDESRSSVSWMTRPCPRKAPNRGSPFVWPAPTVTICKFGSCTACFPMPRRKTRTSCALSMIRARITCIPPAGLSWLICRKRLSSNSKPRRCRRGLEPMSRGRTEYRYEKLTWPEINDAVELGKVCIVPCGAVEQHGPHLPLDVDLVCPNGIAHGTGKQIPDKLLVL